MAGEPITARSAISSVRPSARPTSREAKQTIRSSDGQRPQIAQPISGHLVSSILHTPAAPRSSPSSHASTAMIEPITTVRPCQQIHGRQICPFRPRSPHTAGVSSLSPWSFALPPEPTRPSPPPLMNPATASRPRVVTVCQLRRRPSVLPASPDLASRNRSATAIYSAFFSSAKTFSFPPLAISFRSTPSWPLRLPISALPTPGSHCFKSQNPSTR